MSHTTLPLRGLRSTGFGVDRVVPCLRLRGGAGNSRDWSCSLCTFINKWHATACKMCATANPSLFNCDTTLDDTASIASSIVCNKRKGRNAIDTYTPGCSSSTPSVLRSVAPRLSVSSSPHQTVVGNSSSSSSSSGIGSSSSVTVPRPGPALCTVNVFDELPFLETDFSDNITIATSSGKGSGDKDLRAGAYITCAAPKGALLLFFQGSVIDENSLAEVEADQQSGYTVVLKAPFVNPVDNALLYVDCSTNARHGRCPASMVNCSAGATYISNGKRIRPNCYLDYINGRPVLRALRRLLPDEELWWSYGRGSHAIHEFPWSKYKYVKLTFKLQTYVPANPVVTVASQPELVSHALPVSPSDSVHVTCDAQADAPTRSAHVINTPTDSDIDSEATLIDTGVASSPLTASPVAPTNSALAGLLDYDSN